MNRGAILLLALAALPFAAGRNGHRGDFSVLLRLGPGDSPFLRGFAPEFEIEEGQGTHWTGPDGVVDFPLRVTGNGVLAYRLARVLPETGHVDVLVNGRVVDRFSCRGGRLVDRQVALPDLQGAPLTVAFHVEGRDERQLGVKLHFLRVSGAGRAALRGFVPQAKGSLLFVLLAALLVLAGFSTLETSLVVAPLALGSSLLLLRDPFLALRLMTFLPETLLVCGLPTLLWARRAAGEARFSWSDLRLCTLCTVLAFLFRAALLNHPDFYYPDFMLHARLVQVVRGAGWDFLLSPARHLWAPRAGAADGLVRSTSGLWMRSLNGVPLGMPYSLAFHGLFAFWPLGYDQILTLIRIAGALCSAITCVGAFAFARRTGLGLWGIPLMVVVPSYLAKLSVGALPAVFGHAVDVAFLAWLASRKPRAMLVGVVLVAACDLAYVSAIIHLSVFLLTWAALRALETRRVKDALLPVFMLTGGGLLAFVVYYRDFLPAVLALVRGAGGAGGSSYQEEAFLPLLVDRTVSFFGWGYPILALAGLLLLLRRGRAGLLLPWGIAYLVLLFLRAEIPLVFRWVHDTLFVTPFLCLTAGEVLLALWEAGKRALALGLLLAFVLQGVILGWLSVSAEFGRIL